MSNKKAPELRFKGYTQDWELCKLEELARFNPKSNLPEVFQYVDLESVEQSRMVSHRKESRESAPSRAKRLAEKGDVFFQTVRPYQKNNYLFDLPYHNYVFSTGYAQLRPKGDSYFLLNRLQEEHFVSKVLDRCTGTSYPAINSSDLAQIKVGVPKEIEEQNQIGNFLKYIDITITLHQRKLEQLGLLKKAYLQQMFPDKEIKVPRLRFVNFNEDWELCKFEDILKSHPFKQYLAEPTEDGNFPVIQQGDKPIIGYSNGEPYEDFTHVTLFGDHTVSLFKPTKPFFVATDGVKILSVENFEGDYLFYVLEQYKPESQGYKRHFTILKNEKCFFTENKEEQIRIGNFLKKLDKTITLHQNETSTLEKLKASYLQKMFI